MADWIEKLLPATIEDVPFKVRSSDMPVGMRLDIVAYPFSDAHWVDEMGREVRVLRMQAFIVDNNGDLAAQRDALFKVLETSGSKRLVHPRLGEMEVVSGPATWRTEDGGVESISMTFVPPGMNSVTVTTPRTDNQLSSAIDDAQNSAGQQTDDGLDFSNHGLIDEAQDVADHALESLRHMNGQLNAATAPISQIALSITNIGDELGDLIRQPSALAGKIGSVYAAIYGTVNAPLNAFRTPAAIIETATGERSAKRVNDAFTSYHAITDALNSTAPVIGSTPTRNIERTNQTAIINLLSTTALLRLCTHVVSETQAVRITSNTQSPFDNVNDARQRRDELVRDLQTHATAMAGNAFVALSAVASAVVKHLDAHGQLLPRLRTVQFGNTLPALVIAHKVHGDATQVDDLVRRNNLRNPLAVPAFMSLEVLHDA